MDFEEDLRQIRERRTARQSSNRGSMRINLPSRAVRDHSHRSESINSLDVTNHAYSTLRTVRKRRRDRLEREGDVLNGSTASMFTGNDSFISDDVNESVLQIRERRLQRQSFDSTVAKSISQKFSSTYEPYSIRKVRTTGNKDHQRDQEVDSEADRQAQQEKLEAYAEEVRREFTKDWRSSCSNEVDGQGRGSHNSSRGEADITTWYWTQPMSPSALHLRLSQDGNDKQSQSLDHDAPSNMVTEVGEGGDASQDAGQAPPLSVHDTPWYTAGVDRADNQRQPSLTTPNADRRSHRPIEEEDKQSVASEDTVASDLGSASIVSDLLTAPSHSQGGQIGIHPNTVKSCYPSGSAVASLEGGRPSSQSDGAGTPANIDTHSERQQTAPRSMHDTRDGTDANWTTSQPQTPRMNPYLGMSGTQSIPRLMTGKRPPNPSSTQKHYSSGFALYSEFQNRHDSNAQVPSKWTAAVDPRMIRESRGEGKHNNRETDREKGNGNGNGNGKDNNEWDNIEEGSPLSLWHKYQVPLPGSSFSIQHMMAGHRPPLHRSAQAARTPGPRELDHRSFSALVQSSTAPLTPRLVQVPVWQPRRSSARPL
jgi:hypothetical protein